MRKPSSPMPIPSGVDSTSTVSTPTLEDYKRLVKENKKRVETELTSERLNNLALEAKIEELKIQLAKAQNSVGLKTISTIVDSTPAHSLLSQENQALKAETQYIKKENQELKATVDSAITELDLTLEANLTLQTALEQSLEQITKLTKQVEQQNKSIGQAIERASVISQIQQKYKGVKNAFLAVGERGNKADLEKRVNEDKSNVRTKEEVDSGKNELK